MLHAVSWLLYNRTQHSRGLFGEACKRDFLEQRTTNITRKTFHVQHSVSLPLKTHKNITRKLGSLKSFFVLSTLSCLVSQLKQKMTPTAECKKLLAIRIPFRCYYFNTTLLLNVNTFWFHRLMVFLAVMYRERLVTTTALNEGNHGVA